MGPGAPFCRQSAVHDQVRQARGREKRRAGQPGCPAGKRASNYGSVSARVELNQPSWAIVIDMIEEEQVQMSGTPRVDAEIDSFWGQGGTDGVAVARGDNVVEIDDISIPLFSIGMSWQEVYQGIRFCHPC